LAYTKKTQEQKADGTYITITADFRKYECIEDSIADHSAYLNGAKNGRKLRYKGLKGCKDYRKAAQIIKDGGYATSLTYVDKLCAIIEKWDLTQYDVSQNKTVRKAETVQKVETVQTPYLVKIDIPDLNIREKATIESRSHGFTGVGIFTIVDEDNGWGLLKSYTSKRNGWIKLSFTKRV